jgi:hypothetical protein
LPADVDPGLLQHPLYLPRFEVHGATILPVLDPDLVPPEWLETIENNEDVANLNPEMEPDLEQDDCDVNCTTGFNRSTKEETPEEDDVPDEIRMQSKPLPEFWESGAYEECPIKLNLKAIKQYFEQQKSNYLIYAKTFELTEYYDLLSEEEKGQQTYRTALYTPYSKTWYEYHINETLQYATLNFDIEYALRAGRLIEQYYWKFIHEHDAIEGTRVRQGRVAAAAAKASNYKPEHERWQRQADAIWDRKPNLKKRQVAILVKRGLKLTVTSRHIERHIKKRSKAPK